MEPVEKYVIINNNISAEEVSRLNSGHILYVKYASLYSVNHNCDVKSWDIIVFIIIIIIIIDEATLFEP
jgi:hypothetical protein